MGSKFTLEFSVSGGAEDSLRRLEHGLTEVGRQANEMKHGMEEAGEGIESLKRMGEFFTFEKIIEQFEKVTEKAQEFAKILFEKGTEVAKDFMKTASEFEDIQSSFRFSFAEGWDEMYAKTYKESQHLAFTFKQSADLVAKLGQMGVNAFGGMGDAMLKFKGKTGEQLSMLEVVQDTLIGTGRGFAFTQNMMRGMHEAVNGNFREFKNGLGVNMKAIEEMKHRIGSAGNDMQKRTEIVTEVLAKFYGGATRFRANNLSFQIQQLTDKFEFLKESIAGPGLKIVTGGLADFVASLQRLLDNKEAVQGLASAFQLLQKAIAWVFRAAAAVVDFTSSIIRIVPWLPKVALALTAISVAATLVGSSIVLMGLSFMGLTGTLLLATASVLAFNTATGGMLFSLLPIGIALGVLIAGFAAIVALVSLPLIAGFIGMMVGGAQILSDKWGTVYTVFDKLKILFTAFGELIDTYNGSTSEMSIETADKLKATGLLGFVLEVMDVYNRLHHAWVSFMDTLEQVGEYIKPVFLPMLDELKGLFLDLADALGFSKTGTDINAKSVSDWVTIGREMGIILLKLTYATIQLVRAGLHFIDFTMQILGLKEATSETAKTFKFWLDILEKIFGYAMRLADTVLFNGTFSGIWDSMKGAFGAAFSQGGNIADLGKGSFNSEAKDKVLGNLVEESAARTETEEANKANTLAGGLPYGINTLYSSQTTGGSSKELASKPDTGAGSDNGVAATIGDLGKITLEGHAKVEKAVKDLASRPIQANLMLPDATVLMSMMQDARTPIAGGI